MCAAMYLFKTLSGEHSESLTTAIHLKMPRTRDTSSSQDVTTHRLFLILCRSLPELKASKELRNWFISKNKATIVSPKRRPSNSFM